MPFLSEPEPPRDQAVPVAPGIRRIVARNPGPMTCHGTNTYLIDTPDGLAVLDPGPDDPAHVQAVLAAAQEAGQGAICHILLSHTHADHLGALPALRAATGAPVAAWHDPAIPFGPDIRLNDGDTVVGLRAIHTPGHAPDHLCFAWSGGILFSADHVMAWSSTVVSPPAGSMADYMRSLDRLLSRDDTLYLPGHGPALPDPLPFVRDLRAHRLAREAAILAALGPDPVTTTDLTARLYDVGPDLRRAAERNVVAHLLRLEGQGAATRRGDGWAATPSPKASG